MIPDGSKASFFSFIEEYQALIQKHVPGTFHFEYEARIYMVPVWQHLERVIASTVPGGKVLDLGCGRGHFSAYLSLRGLSVDGVDVKNPVHGDDFLHNQDPKAIDTYPQLWAESNATYHCRCGYYDGAKLPFADASFDTVLFYATFEHVPVEYIRSVVADTYRVLKPGGKVFIFRCPSSWAWKEHLTQRLGMGAHNKRYGKSEALGILKDAGYELVSFDRSDFFPAHVAPVQGLVNALTEPLLLIEKVLRWTPLAYIFHHFKIELRKPL